MSISNNVLLLGKQVVAVFGKVQKMTKGHFGASILALLGAFALGVSGGQASATGVKDAGAVTLCMLLVLMVPLVLMRYFREGMRLLSAAFKDFKASPEGISPKLGFAVFAVIGVVLLVAPHLDPTTVTQTINQASKPTRMYGFSIAGIVALLFVLNWMLGPASNAQPRMPKAKRSRFGRRKSKPDSDVGIDGLFERAS